MLGWRRNTSMEIKFKQNTYVTILEKKSEKFVCMDYHYRDEVVVFLNVLEELITYSESKKVLKLDFGRFVHIIPLECIQITDVRKSNKIFCST